MGWTGSSGAGVVPRRVWWGTAAADSRVEAFGGVVAKASAFGTLSCGAKAEASFKAEGGGEGGQARQDYKVLCLRSSDLDHNGRGEFASALLFWSQPSGLLCEREPSVVDGEFFSTVGKRVKGGDAVPKKLCSGRVQVDSSGTRDEVEELGNFAVKRGSPNRLHGSEK